MNRRISDLLDTYSDPNIELGINTPLSSERIKALTMSKINKEPKQRKRIKELNSDVDGYYQMFSTDHFSELESPVDAYDLLEDSPLAPMGVQWKFDWLPIPQTIGSKWLSDWSKQMVSMPLMMVWKNG